MLKVVDLVDDLLSLSSFLFLVRVSLSLLNMSNSKNSGSTSRSESGNRTTKSSRSNSKNKRRQSDNSGGSAKFVCDDTDTEFHICFMCDIKYTDQKDSLLQCDRCDSWACIGCLKMSSETYSAIARPDLRWFCDQCVQPALLSVKTDKAIEDKCKEFLEAVEARISHVETELMNKASLKDLDSLSRNVKSLEEKISQLSSTQNEVDTKLCEVTANATNDGVREMAEREARKDNLILFNAPVNDSEEPETRKEADFKFFKQLCSQGLGLESAVDPKKIIRLGKRGDDKRPMKVTLKNSDQVSQVLRATKSLKNKEEFKQISISRDRTPLEREESRALWKLKESKQQESDQKQENARWIIRGKRVVNALREAERMIPPHTGKDKAE